MTLLVPLFLGTLLSALPFSVDAKSKADQIRLYQFVTDNCDGSPLGANVDIKLGHCVSLDARSVKPRLDEKRKKWVDDVNSGDLYCWLAIYDQAGCTGPDSGVLAGMSLPHEIDDCYTASSSDTIRSAKFVCDAKERVFGIESTSTETVTATSFSIGSDNVPTPSTTTETQTITTSHNTTTTLSPTLAARDLAPRQGDVAYKWMKHPWTDTTMCYQCYTKKPGKYDWVKCLSHAKTPAEYCGDKPVDANGNPLTTTTTVTTTATTLTTTVAATYEGTSIETTTTTLPATTALPTADAPVAERSWHKEVTFRLPWADGRPMCADAEWDSRGKANWELRLQEVHADECNDCKGAIDIDLPAMILETATVTDGVIETETFTGWTTFSTTTVTVFTSHVTTIATAASTDIPATTSASTSSLEPVVVEILEPITIEANAETVITVTTSSTIFPETAETTVARAEAPPHRDL